MSQSSPRIPASRHEHVPGTIDQLITSIAASLLPTPQFRLGKLNFRNRRVMLAEGATRGVQDDRFHETHPIGCHHSSLVNLACRSYILICDPIFERWRRPTSHCHGLGPGARGGRGGGGVFWGGVWGEFHGGWGE